MVLVAAMSFLATCSESPTAPPRPPVLPTVLIIATEFDGVLAKGEVRQFDVSSTPGVALRIFFQASSGSAADSLIAVVRQDSTGPVLGTLATNGAQASLADRIVHVGATDASVLYRISIRGAAADDQGAFRLLAANPGIGPEHVSDQFVMGDTVDGERFDAMAERDRFVFISDPASEYIITLAQQDSQPGRTIWMWLWRNAGTGVGDIVAQVPFSWKPTTFEERAVRYVSSATEPLLLEFEAPGVGIPRVGPPDPAVDGRYSFWMRKVNPLPESRAPGVTYGDVILDSIDAVGDIDEYRLMATAGDEFRLDVWWQRPLSAAMEISVVGPKFGITREELRIPRARFDGKGWSFLSDTAGPITIRLRGGLNGKHDSVTTPYRLALRRIVRTPETAAQVLTGADTITREGIERAGDIDEYLVTLAPRVVKAVRVTLGADVEGTLLLRAVAPNGIEIWRSELSSTNPIFYGSLMGEDPGAIMLQLSGYDSSIGSYRIETNPIDRRTEVIDSLLPVGSWVSGETLVPGADVDDFLFPVTQGKRYNLFVDRAPSAVGDPILRLDTPFAGLLFATPGMGGATGGFTAPATENARLHVVGDVTGAYRILVYVVDSMPESIPVAHTLGDTISGEAIDVAGDIDVFTFEGVAGDRVVLGIGADPINPTREFRFAVFAPDGSLLPTPDLLGPVTVTLPTTGTYRAIVMGATERDVVAGTGRYRASVTRAP